MDAVILAGGLGTRLRSVITDVPKPLAMVAGRPFLDYQLDMLAASGIVERVVLSLGHLADRVIDHYRDHPPPLPIEFAVEPEPLGTGGGLRLALPMVRGRLVLSMNGDSLFRWDIPAIEAAHERARAEATLSLVGVDNTSRYGAVKATGGRVTSFVEKQDATGPGLINAGVYVFDRSVIEHIPMDRAVSLEVDVLPVLIARGTVAAAVFDSDFIDIGLPETYRMAPAVLPRIVPRLPH